jgi:GT2 family glycosyltransferase
MRKIPVAVVILNWNGLELTDACLKSWAKASPAPERIMVVDNGSKDGSPAALKRRFPKVELLALKENLGYAAGNNRGFERIFSKGKAPQAVFVCNNDTVVEAGMLGKLWSELEARPAWGIAGPKILFFEGSKVWFKGGLLRALTGRPGHFGYLEEDQPGEEPFTLFKQGFVTGCGLLIRSRLLRQLQGFDEGYWAYCEDSDLCLRARQLGWESGVVPAARMRHKVSATFQEGSALASYYGTRNSLFLMKRHGLSLGLLSRFLFVGIVCGKRLLGACLRGQWEKASAILAGLRDYALDRRGAWLP